MIARGGLSSLISKVSGLFTPVAGKTFHARRAAPISKGVDNGWLIPLDRHARFAGERLGERIRESWRPLFTVAGRTQSWPYITCRCNMLYYVMSTTTSWELRLAFIHCAFVRRRGRWTSQGVLTARTTVTTKRVSANPLVPTLDASHVHTCTYRARQ